MSIRDELQRIREQKAKRSEAGSARYLQNVQGRAAQLKNKNLGGGDTLPEAQMRVLYFSMVDKYYKQTSVPMLSEMSAKSMALWKRVVRVQQRSNKDAEQFLRAQFTFYDKAFGKAPKAFQLTTEASITRANEFSNSTKVAPVSGGVEYKLDKAEKFRQAEKKLLEIQRIQGLTREEVYRNLVIPGHLYIDPSFLKIDPVYFTIVNEK